MIQINNEIVLQAGILHAIISFAIALLSVIVLNKRYENQKKYLFMFFFAFSVAIPFFGILLSLWLIIYFRSYSHFIKELAFETVNLDPFLESFPLVKRKFGDAAFVEMTENDKIPIIKKLAAMTMLSDKKSPDNIKLIKTMLSSKDDEIRLFAFAAIDSVESDIHKKIHYFRIKLENAADDIASFKYKRLLAFAYWELVYFNLADEVLKTFLLQKTEGYMKEVIEHDPKDADAFVLLGKVYFSQGEIKSSKEAFLSAIRIYKTKEKRSTDFIKSYLAEIYYNEKEYEKVREIIENTKYFELLPKLKSIKEVWNR